MMEIYDIALRLILTVVFAGLIGFEREVSQSNAGLRTHILVGVGAATVALIQMGIVNFSVSTNIAMEAAGTVTGIVRSDPARLIAQVVSGIGFLGAGTIIVTKRNISGLTTAASIWTVACIGLALGMGFYEIAIGSFIVTFLTLIVLKGLVRSIVSERIVIKYLHGEETLVSIESIFSEMDVEARPIKFSVSPFGNEYVFTNTFEIKNSKGFKFAEFVDRMSHKKNIISVERTNIQ